MIQLTEIEKKVYERYPVTEKERNCRVERDKRNWLRAQLKKEYEQKEFSKHIYEGKPEV
jgi:disulfide oxidoreductase YuzD